MINNQNILDQNVNTLKRQFNDATDYLKKAQTKADTLKNQLNNANSNGRLIAEINELT